MIEIIFEIVSLGGYDCEFVGLIDISSKKVEEILHSIFHA